MNFILVIDPNKYNNNAFKDNSFARVRNIIRTDLQDRSEHVENVLADLWNDVRVESIIQEL